MGFEPTNGGFADQSWIAILLVRLAFTPALLADFSPDLGPIVPKLFPVVWGEPLRWHNFFGHSFPFRKARCISNSPFSPYIGSYRDSFNWRRKSIQSPELTASAAIASDFLLVILFMHMRSGFDD